VADEWGIDGGVALAGMILPTVLLLAGSIRDVAFAISGLIPAIRVLRSLIYEIASVAVTVFLYFFHKRDPSSRYPITRHLAHERRATLSGHGVATPHAKLAPNRTPLRDGVYRDRANGLYMPVAEWQ
jgi:hypothetical protein